MNFNFTKTCGSALLLAAMSFGMEAQAQNLEEGWYQIKRTMSASDLDKQLEDFDLSKILSFVHNITRSDYLYVKEEFPVRKKTYGATYKESVPITKPVKNSEINTYFYVTPVEGEKEAYTIRSYNGHYLHSDGTFSVSAETLYLNAPMDVNIEGSGEGLSGSITNIANLLIKGLETIGGYSVGEKSKTYTLDPSLLGLQTDFKFTISYKDTSWQQKLETSTTEEGDDEIDRNDYLDAKKVNIISIIPELLKIDVTDATSIIRFIMRTFSSDSYQFEKVNLSEVGALLETKYELIPYTVQIEGWDGTVNVEPRDYAAADYFTKLNQFTHGNASIMLNSKSTHKDFVPAPIYNGGTIFATKTKPRIGKPVESKFINEGEHGCSDITKRDYTYAGGITPNAPYNMTNYIMTTCIDEENHIVYVYFTEPGKEWKVSVAKDKFVTGHAPFALNIAASETEGAFMWKKTYTSEAYYATGVDNEEVVLVKLEGVIPANTGVLIKNTSKESGNHEFKYTIASKENQTLEAPADNLLHGVCFAYDLDADVNAYVLKTIDGKQKFYKLNQEDRKLAPWRAYLEWDGAAGSALRIAGFEEGVEGVDTVLAPEEENAPIYDLSGRRVSHSNGVTISAGKKYINK